MNDIKYTLEDFAEFKNNLTPETAAEILSELEDQYPYEEPTFTDINSQDFENYKICCALSLATKILNGENYNYKDEFEELW